MIYGQACSTTTARQPVRMCARATRAPDPAPSRPRHTPYRLRRRRPPTHTGHARRTAQDKTQKSHGPAAPKLLQSGVSPRQHYFLAFHLQPRAHDPSVRSVLYVALDGRRAHMNMTCGPGSRLGTPWPNLACLMLSLRAATASLHWPPAARPRSPPPRRGASGGTRFERVVS
jgi:hypothetical protein